MKRFSYLPCLLVITTLLFSCGSDDGGGIDSNLFATWTKTNTVLRDCGNSNDNGTTSEVCDDQVCETLTITDNLRYELSTLVRGQAQVERGQIQIGETQLNFLPDNTTGNTIYEYTVTSGSLTLSNVTVICTEDFVYSK